MQCHIKAIAAFFSGIFTSPIACKIPLVSVDKPKKTTPGLPTANKIVASCKVSFCGKRIPMIGNARTLIPTAEGIKTIIVTRMPERMCSLVSL